MNIIEKLLTVNPYSRCGRRLPVCRGIVFHYTGMPDQRAVQTWNYFEKTCPAEQHCSSAHYIIDLNGDIYHAVPDNEAAWHCGSDKKDPASGRVYTDWARARFGHYALDCAATSPNFCTVGVELCIDRRGNFTGETVAAAVELAAKLLAEQRLSVKDIGSHQMVVGWKECPQPWAANPALFDEFIKLVKQRLGVLL